MFSKIHHMVGEHSHVTKGTVLEEKEHNYSSTSVFSEGGAVSSRVHHHQEQRIWYKTDDGKEDSVKFYNRDVEFRKGHRIALIYSNKTGRLMRLVNLTTRYYWSISYKHKGKGASQRLGYLLTRAPLYALMAVFSALPFINILTGIAALFGKTYDKPHFPNKLVLRTLSIAAFFIIVAFWMPFLIETFHIESLYAHVPTLELGNLPYIGNLTPTYDLMLVAGVISAATLFVSFIWEANQIMSVAESLDKWSIHLMNNDEKGDIA